MGHCSIKIRWAPYLDTTFQDAYLGKVIVHHKPEMLLKQNWFCGTVLGVNSVSYYKSYRFPCIVQTEDQDAVLVLLEHIFVQTR